MREDCIFCRIVSGAAPCHKVYEDERALAFMDIFPVAEGHVLIIPKAHFENLFEGRDADLAAAIAASRRVALAIRAALSPDGLAVYQANGTAAGQTVFHYHQHLLPRNQGDPFQLHSREPGDPERLQAIAERIRTALPD